MEYLSVGLTVGTSTIMIRRLHTPGPLDLITVTFERGKQARKFQPLAWYGPEVTGDPAYQGRTMALAGADDEQDLNGICRKNLFQSFK